MTLNNWIPKVLGKYVKRNKTTKGYQCTDLAKDYCVQVFDFFKRYPYLKEYWSFGDARQWYSNYSRHKELTANFSRIANNSAFTPIEGDICIFTEHNDFGHICVAYNNKSTTNKIYTIDQNYPTGSKVKYCIHRYTQEGFLGVLRPYRYIRADVNVREKPSMSGKIVGEKKTGERVKIVELDSTKKWAKIDKDKWISYSYVKEVGQ